MLPLPAMYVIVRTGTIRWAFADADCPERAEPAGMLTDYESLTWTAFPSRPTAPPTTLVPSTDTHEDASHQRREKAGSRT
ncbi:hypothetical protein [Streptomyces sp. NPDC051677]|uniref:hypothetical protein n=1 Tax=Streptomyces sp. NPDC051677 TaxID=3365669 RepID=UPI0037D01D23